MFRLLPAVGLLLPLLPNLMSAQCANCDSYTAALKSCQTTSANVTAVGTTMDSTTIHCMCTTKSGVTEMNACQACDESNPSTDLAPLVLSAWTTTCTADGQFGDQQAASCWESQPSNFMPCVSKTEGSGSVGGNTGSGASATISAGSQSTTTPTTKAKSGATLSLQAPVLLLVSIFGLGVTIVL